MTKLPTLPIHLNEVEVALMLPTLQFIKEQLDRSRWAAWAPRERIYGPRYPGNVFRDQHYDDEWLVKVLEVWNKLRNIPAHRKVRCDAFDIAILALALRTTRHNDLSPLAKKARTPARFSALERKLENLRRQLQRAAAKKVGEAAFQALRKRWKGFRSWLRYNILCFKRRRCPDSVNMLRRERREATRRFALEVVRPEVADDATARKQIIALADCARTEIQRGRHPGQWLSTLLRKPDAAKEFFANYIAEWGNPEWVQPKFWPWWYRSSVNGELSVRARTTGAPVAGGPRLQPGEAAALGSPNSVPGHLAVETDPQILPGEALPRAPRSCDRTMLAEIFSQWLLENADPCLWDGIVDEIQFQLTYFPRNHLRRIRTARAVDIIQECKPPSVRFRATYELLSFYAEWGTPWLLVLSKKFGDLYSAVREGAKLALAAWKKARPSTNWARLESIYRSYYAPIGA